MEAWLVIGISGVTNGGKSTLAKSLQTYFSSHLNKAVFKKNITMNKVALICQDDYFLPVNSPKHKVIEKLNHINWEILSSIDMDRMCHDIMRILGHKFLLYDCQKLSKSEDDNNIAEQIYLTRDDDNIFADHFLSNYLNRYDENVPSGSQRPSNLNKKSKNDSFQNKNIKLNVLIIEGFLIFNHNFTMDLCNIKFHIHLPYEKCYARRMQRVYDPPDVVGYFEMCVWPMYEKHYKEFTERTDIYMLNGEIPKLNIFNYVLNSIINLM
ncbi:nicotinamide riboside kinase 1 [Toxorhynchites rutilus septentrionalis]|uniref:nicotinamide riboside kinase 1 n=1 Tax=Toxorhynchites rutilus septentrionalis TaxID=329112 RepID=UPI002479EA97|nr:nicotinamide riboside kinase 1 [Toxorhynchites rutilus septentrionalis]XP_055625894.1 nicotinamide riboside kinase 1 [Toxorhynchites rutilus septentrionalis]